MGIIYSSVSLFYIFQFGEQITIAGITDRLAFVNIDGLNFYYCFRCAESCVFSTYYTQDIVLSSTVYCAITVWLVLRTISTN